VNLAAAADTRTN